MDRDADEIKCQRAQGTVATGHASATRLCRSHCSSLILCLRLAAERQSEAQGARRHVEEPPASEEGRWNVRGR